MNKLPVVVFLFLASCGILQSQILKNGNFEISIIDLERGHIRINQGDSSVDYWTVDSGNVDYIGSLWEASEGSHSIDLNGLQAGSISQEVNTIIDSCYNFSFDLAGNPESGPRIKDLTVTINNSVFDFTFDVTGYSHQNMGWQTQSLSYTATNSLTRISFISHTVGTGGPALDNVSFQQCIDCAGIVDGSFVIDQCGECLDPIDPLFNQSCVDCSGMINGPFVVDSCGNCLDPIDPLFNQSCIDCSGMINGPFVVDNCGDCLDPIDPLFNQSCVDCAGTLNGQSIVDLCGQCLDPIDPLFNQSCVDCAGVLNGTFIIDECGQCLSPNDQFFNRNCEERYNIYVPNVFTPNKDGSNDFFQIVKQDDQLVLIRSFKVYDRWGNQVFLLENTVVDDNTQWWDGTYNGEKVESGIFIYQIEIEFSDGFVKQIKGTVNVL